MKGTRFKLLAPVLLVLSVQPAFSNFNSVWPRGPGLLFGSMQDRDIIPLGWIANSAAARNLHGDISERQQECQNAGWVPCSNIPDRCCPVGTNCFEVGVCCHESPAGLQPCPAPYQQWCYIPSSQICCQNGACAIGTNCCENQCCYSTAYCGSDGSCSLCPATTETETATTTSTTVHVVVVTDTEMEEPEEASDFTCVPITVTNSKNATLELDTDCALSYSPPSTTATTSSAATPAAVIRNALLWERQVSCTPFETDTEFVTLTSTVTRYSTVTETITTSPSESEFSCPTMAVTNAAGDVLSLDDSCSLEFSPASTTSSSTTAGSNGAGSGNSGQKSAAISIYKHRVVAWWIFVVGFLVLLIL